MKILLFSHGSDIDGMGSLIISKIYFDEVKYHYCEMNNIDNMIRKSIETKEIDDYDLIFVTDLCPNNDTLEIISNREDLKGKFQVIDHHKTRLNNVGKYDFVKIIIEDEKGQCSATSLFYDYLVRNHFIEEKDVVNTYSELTRLEDTWEWKKTNTPLAHNLSHLFNILGREEYVRVMTNKLQSQKNFQLTYEEQILIDCKVNEIDKVMESYYSCIKDIEIDNLKGALVIIDYQYRNEFPEYLERIHSNYDFAMMVCFNHHSISFRSITDCNVRFLAEKYGGGGHDKAASCDLKEKEEEIYGIILRSDYV